jgi:hypothetical protein
MPRYEMPGLDPPMTSLHAWEDLDQNVRPHPSGAELPLPHICPARDRAAFMVVHHVTVYHVTVYHVTVHVTCTMWLYTP